MSHSEIAAPRANEPPPQRNTSAIAGHTFSFWRRRSRSALVHHPKMQSRRAEARERAVREGRRGALRLGDARAFLRASSGPHDNVGFRYHGGEHEKRRDAARDDARQPPRDVRVAAVGLRAIGKGKGRGRGGGGGGWSGWWCLSNVATAIAADRSSSPPSLLHSARRETRGGGGHWRCPRAAAMARGCKTIPLLSPPSLVLYL